MNAKTLNASRDASPTMVQRLVRRFYPEKRVDPLDALYCKLAQPGMAVLDAGCGGDRGCSRDAPWQKMYIVGVDCTPDVGRNPFCNEKAVSDLARLPFQDATFDLIHCRWVMEHLPDPLAVFREFARVLKPGGQLVALTPNLYHYATLAARWTPHWFHRWWWGDEFDPFPTVYRANTRRALRGLCRQAGLSVVAMRMIEGPPGYLKGNCLAFLCGTVYERVVNRIPKLATLRQRIVIHAANRSTRD